MYEVQYKMTGDNDSTLTAVIEGDVGSLFTIEGLDNAASYEVLCVCVCVCEHVCACVGA